MTLIIAHRGASRAAPENTVAAFRRAVEMGADAIELDVRRTGDDRLVVHHDPSIADGRAIRELSAGELPGWVPEMSDALDACGAVVVNVEIKNDPHEPDHDPTDWVAEQVARELERRGDPARWLISSFRYDTIARCRELSPAVATAWLTERIGPDEIARSVAGGHAAIHPWVPTVDRAAVDAAHAAGLAVNVWTCDDPDRMRELIGWGIDGICTNVPDVALAVRAAASAG